MRSVEQRLKVLCRRPGGPTPAGGELAARIDRLRMKGGVATRQRDDPDGQLAAALSGKVVADGLLLLETRLPLASFHGVYPLVMLNRPLDGLPAGNDLASRRLLCLDTETTGLSGGSGTLIFMLGTACVEADSLMVRQLLLSRYCGERPMLQLARAWLGEGDTLITYNGSSFDLPLLASRCRLNRMDNPFQSRPHLDLLYPTRRAFSASWTDCRLATVERRLLGFRRRQDLPGSEAPKAWRGWAARQEWLGLQGVCRHNLWDLVSLALLLPVLSDVYRDPLPTGADILAVARGYLQSGREAQAIRLLQRCSSTMGDAGQRELRRLLKRRERKCRAAPSVAAAVPGDRSPTTLVRNRHKGERTQIEKTQSTGSLRDFPVNSSDPLP